MCSGKWFCLCLLWIIFCCCLRIEIFVLQLQLLSPISTSFVGWVGWLLESTNITPLHPPVFPSSFRFPFVVLVYCTAQKQREEKNYESFDWMAGRLSVCLPDWLSTSHQTYFIKLSEFGFFNSVLWWITSVRNGLIHSFFLLTSLLWCCCVRCTIGNLLWDCTALLEVGCFAFALTSKWENEYTNDLLERKCSLSGKKWKLLLPFHFGFLSYSRNFASISNDFWKMWIQFPSSSFFLFAIGSKDSKFVVMIAQSFNRNRLSF